jgi:cobalamin biosynthesis protein CobD/CbiB
MVSSQAYSGSACEACAVWLSTVRLMPWMPCGVANERYRYFGWAAARLDDVLNVIPAHLVAFSDALMGQLSPAMAAAGRYLEES